MQTVTFAREYRHPLPGHRTAIYPPDVSVRVSKEVLDAASMAGALMPEPEKDEADGE